MFDLFPPKGENMFVFVTFRAAGLRLSDLFRVWTENSDWLRGGGGGDTTRQTILMGGGTRGFQDDEIDYPTGYQMQNVHLYRLFIK